MAVEVITITPEQLRQIIREELAALRPEGAAAPDDADVLTTEEAAALVRVKPKTLAGWIRSGRLKATRPGGREYRIARADLLACTRGERSAVDPADAAREMMATLRR